MSPLARFSTPGNLTELPDAGRAAWSTRVRAIFHELVGDFPQFFDPTVTDADADQATQAVTWVAFPAKVRDRATSDEERWGLADGRREVQDEYCEWSVARTPDGRIARVTFTSETPEYYEQLLESDEQRLLELYEQYVGQPVSLDDLRGADGSYDKRNRWNASTGGPIAHLQQDSNTLEAAIILAATATVLRHDAQGRSVVNQQELVRCGKLGEPARNSDPQIAAAVNQLAAQRFDVSLADPPGLYIDDIVTTGIETPDGTDPASFWTVVRGDADHVVRARFEVPDGLGYVVGDLTLAGRPIAFGGQLADRVSVTIAAVAQPGTHRPQSKPCKA